MLQHVADSSAQSAELAPQAASAPAPLFAPTGQMHAFAWAVIEILSEQRPYTDVEACQRACISRTTLWDWRKRRAGFSDWLAEQVDLANPYRFAFARVVVAMTRKAEAGSVRAAKWLFELEKLRLGATRDVDRPIPMEDRGPQIVFNLPRPTRELEGQTVVVGMKLT